MLSLFIGDDFVRIASITTAEGNPYPLGGCTLWWTVTEQHGRPDSEAIAKLYWSAAGSSDGITVDTPIAGEAEVRLTPAQSALFEQRAYYYDLQLDDADGRVVTIDHGVLMARWAPTTRTTTP
jgi:hypothetical protein